MTDYISREAAVKCVYGHNAETVARLNTLPATDVVEVVHGEWTIVTLPPDPGYKAKECSVCRCNFWDLEEWNYCPNCGARMDKAEAALGGDGE